MFGYSKYKLLLVTKYFSLLPLWFLGLLWCNNGVPHGQIINSTPSPLRVILIDPGHGGKDVGCQGNHLNEKEVALDLALRIRSKLAQVHPEIEVRLTREKDVFIPLHKRAEMANAEDVDLFISIHCNALENPSASGIETYVMGLHTAEENLEIAKRENDVILLEEPYGGKDGLDIYSPEVHILASLWQQSTLENSILLADFTQSAISRNTSLRDRGVKQAGFVVLRKVIVPSILIEAGFLSNPHDAEMLSSEKGREDLADSISEGIRAYIHFRKDQ